MPIGRSLLFVPANRPERISKALTSSASSVAVDLEDGVSGKDKESARGRAAEALAGTARSGVFIRINGLETKWAEADLETIAEVAGAMAGILVPKVEGVDSLRHVDAALTAMEKDSALTPASRVVVPIIETARGVLNAAEIAAGPRVGAVVFGTLDLAAQLEVTPTVEGTELLYARSQVILAAANARVERLDGPYPALDDTEGLRQSCAASRLLGFSGRVVLHPGQLDTVNGAYGPTDSELRWAEEIVATCRGAGADAEGSLRSPGGDFIDAPVLARAARYLGIEVQDVYR